MKEIKKRWEERIVKNGWDKLGAEGARLYLEKYGKGIGKDKLKKFMGYAYSQGLQEFGDEFKKSC